AYPAVNHTIIAHKMGKQGILSSLCPIHVHEMGTGDPLYGYRPAVKAIIDRLKNSLSNQCLPQKLTLPQGETHYPCLILVQLPQAGPAGSCAHPGSACDPGQGLVGPGSSVDYPQDIWDKFCQSQKDAWKAAGGMNSGAPDPDTVPVCALQQLTQA